MKFHRLPPLNYYWKLILSRNLNLVILRTAALHGHKNR